MKYHTSDPAKIEAVVRRALVLAHKACGGAIGMGKLAIKVQHGHIEISDGTPRIDCQGWAGTYPSHKALLEAAASDVGVALIPCGLSEREPPCPDCGHGPCRCDELREMAADETRWNDGNV